MLTPILTVKTATPSAPVPAPEAVLPKEKVPVLPAALSGRQSEAALRILETINKQLLGSDMPPFWDFEGTSAVVRELEHMQAGGLAASGVVHAATAAPARWLDADDRVGAGTVVAP